MPVIVLLRLGLGLGSGLGLGNPNPNPLTLTLTLTLTKGDYELIRAIGLETGAEADDDAAMDAALQVEEAHAMAWAWVVARQLLLLFESDVVVARAALGCERCLLYTSPSPRDR